MPSTTPWARERSMSAPTAAFRSMRSCTFDARAVGYIESDGFATDFAGERFDAVDAASACDHVEAGGCEGSRGCFADAGTGACDDGNGFRAVLRWVRLVCHGGEGTGGRGEEGGRSENS